MILLNANARDMSADPIAEIYSECKDKFSAEYDQSFEFPFTKFELFRNYSNCFISNVIKLNNGKGDFYLACVRSDYRLSTASKYPSSGFSESQAWGIATLKSDYGHIMIKPETMLDKIHELICPVELDFEDDKEFSKEFYVVTNDRLKASLKITPRFRELIKNIAVKDFIIEIINNKLLIGNKKHIEPADCIDFIHFLDRSTAF